MMDCLNHLNQEMAINLNDDRMKQICDSHSLNSPKNFDCCTLHTVTSNSNDVKQQKSSTNSDCKNSNDAILEILSATIMLANSLYRNIDHWTSPKLKSMDEHGAMVESINSKRMNQNLRLEVMVTFVVVVVETMEQSSVFELVAVDRMHVTIPQLNVDLAKLNHARLLKLVQLRERFER